MNGPTNAYIMSFVLVRLFFSAANGQSYNHNMISESRGVVVQFH
jgi:hypothetical protein